MSKDGWNGTCLASLSQAANWDRNMGSQMNKSGGSSLLLNGKGQLTSQIKHFKTIVFNTYTQRLPYFEQLWTFLFLSLSSTVPMTEPRPWTRQVNSLPRNNKKFQFLVALSKYLSRFMNTLSSLPTHPLSIWSHYRLIWSLLCGAGWTRLILCLCHLLSI